VQRFGLLNTNIPPNPRQAPGLPFPGHFFIDAHGTVIDKAFTGDLRHRASASVLAFERFGPLGEPTAQGDGVQVWLSTTRLFGGQEFAVRIVGAGGDDEIAVDSPDGIVGEQSFVDRGDHVDGRVRLRWSPPKSLFAGLDEAVSRRAIPPGAYPLRISTGRVSLTVTIEVSAHVPPPRPI
jgi:hypothetical protein